MEARRKPFPKILLILLLLAITVAAVYFFAIIKGADEFIEWFSGFGEFICKYDTVLIGILLGVNLVEIIDVIIFAKRDETINAVFELKANSSIGVITLFKHYFSGICCRGPLMYTASEARSALIRIIISAVTGVIKFIAWIFVLIAAVGMCMSDEVYNYAIGDGIDYAFTVFVLLMCINCGVFIYALYRILPLHETRTYDVVTQYSDGSTTRHTEHRSNFIGIVFMAGVLYMFSTAYYIFPLSTKLARIIETFRLDGYFESEEYERNMTDFY